MKEQIPLWLGRNARLPGVLAHAVLHPQKGCSSKNWESRAKCASVEESLRALAALAEQAPGLDGGGAELIFDDAWVFGARNGDGTWVFIMTSPEASEEEVASVRRLVADFLNLGSGLPA